MSTKVKVEIPLVPFVKEPTTVNEYMKTLGGLSTKAMKERLHQLRLSRNLVKKLRKAGMASVPFTREEAIAMMNDKLEFELDMIPKLFFLSYEMFVLYIDMLQRLEKQGERISKRPTRKQVKRAVIIKRLDFAKDLLKEGGYRSLAPLPYIKKKRWQSPIEV